MTVTMLLDNTVASAERAAAGLVPATLSVSASAVGGLTSGASR